MNDHMEELRFAGQRMLGGFHQLDNLTAESGPFLCNSRSGFIALIPMR